MVLGITHKSSKADQLTLISIVTPLLKEIQSLSIIFLPTVTTILFPRPTILYESSTWKLYLRKTSHSALVQRESTNHTLTAILQLLLAGATRRKMRAVDQSVSVPERDQLMRDSDAMMALVNAIKKGEDPAVNRWDGVLTVIVGRKGIVFEDGSPWMASRHEMGGV